MPTAYQTPKMAAWRSQTRSKTDPDGGGHGLPGAGHRRLLAVVPGIAGTVLAVEVACAVVSGSLALLADAGRMLTHVAGLALVAAVLLAVGGFVPAEAIRRLSEPSPVASGAMVIFGVVGLAGNAVSIMSRVSGGNLNTRAARLEVINDALGSVAVLAAAAVIALTGWDRAVAVASLLIGALILPRTWKLLRETVGVLMEATPKGVDLAHVRAHILDVPHVRAGEAPLHGEEAAQVAAEPLRLPHVAVRPVDPPPPVREVRVGHDEDSALLQQARDLGELLRLKAAEVLEQALRDDDVELHGPEGNRRLGKVQLHQVRPGFRDGDVDSVVAHAGRHQAGQGGGPASQVKRVAVPLAARGQKSRS